jgi:hypothetical protein
MAKREPSAPFEELREAAEHDARMTAWEQTFVASIREQIEKRDQPWLSDQLPHLPPQVRELVADQSQAHRELLAFAMEARGDPRLTAWEEGFLCSMVEVARACRPLSGKQRDVLERIAAKVGSPFIVDDAGEAVESYPV